jgi:rare lipoprotein A
MRRVTFVLVAVVLLTACGHPKVRASIPSTKESDLEGIASYYAEPYNGRKTASGEIFDTYNAMTAAHKTLPFNTVVRVKNLNNGEEVDVRINDRGPFVKGRVIDLSLLAAKEIGLDRAGVAPVKLKVLKDGSPTTKPAGPAAPVIAAAPPPAPTLPPVTAPLAPIPVPVEPDASDPVISSTPDLPVFGVQVGAFQSRSAAENLRDDLAMRYSDVSIQSVVTDQTLYRVRVGKVPDMETAEQIAKKLRDEHFNTFVVRLN